jgi:hypothetical protein
MAKKQSKTLSIYIVLGVILVGAFYFLKKRSMYEPFQASTDIVQLVGVRISGTEAALKQTFGQMPTIPFTLKDAKTQTILLDSTTNKLTDSVETKLMDVFYPNESLGKINDTPLTLEKTIEKFKGRLGGSFQGGAVIKNLILKNMTTNALLYEPSLSTGSPTNVPTQQALAPLPTLTPATTPTASPADSLSPAEVESLRGLIRRFPPPPPPKPAAKPAAKPVPALPGR